MNEDKLSAVETTYHPQYESEHGKYRIPYIILNNFPALGKLTALRFLEWVSLNPEGVISLPTGKTPEYFIKWTKYLLQNWDIKKVAEIRETHGLGQAQWD